MSDTVTDPEQQSSDGWVKVSFSPDPGFPLQFDGLHAQEELGRPFLCKLDLSGGKIHGDINKIVGASATISLKRSKDDGEQFFNGIVTRVISSGLVDGAYRYHVELRPWIWLLTQVTDCRIYQSKSPFDIITQVFRDAGFPDFQDKRQASAGDLVLEYCVQYRETSFDFVTRLMEQFGLYYYFTHTKNRHTLVIADDPNSFDTVKPSIPFVFDQTEFRSVADHIWEWSTELALLSGKYTARDYNFTIPSADLTAKTVQAGNHPHNTFEVYDYPGAYDQSSNGQRLTDIRMQQISMQRTMIDAVSNSRHLHPGCRFTLSDHPDKPANREYQVIKSEFAMSIAEGASTQDGETMDTYR